MKFEFSHNSQPPQTFRTDAIKTAYDIQGAKFEKHFQGELQIEDQPWNIGLIVGSSGSGKTSIATKCFGEVIKTFKWPKSEQRHSFIDDFDDQNSVEDIQNVLNRVGFSSPVDWLKPFHSLSNGEKMRVELARHILTPDRLFVFDEFTSVVDRQIAMVTSQAVQKAVRKYDKQMIAIACHRDIVEWLQPDWIYDTDSRKFFFMQNQNDHASMQKCVSAQENYGTVLKSITI